MSTLELRIARSLLRRPPERHRYGALPHQVCDLHRPSGRGPHPVAVVLHGGYWQPPYTKLVMRPLCHDLVRRGYAAWNVEYRRLGKDGGGWPMTFDDVAAAIDLLAELGDDRLDLDRVALVGHSAGGQLALWAAARPSLPAGAPGAAPRVVAKRVLALAAVCDLVRAANIASRLLGGAPSEGPRALGAGQPDGADPAHSSFGIVPTSSDRIDARTDPWDPQTEPKPGDFVDPGAQERKAVLLGEAERELDEFIGLEKVKDQVARLKSAVAMELVRKAHGLEVAQRTHHLVFTGPPGTGKTTIARVVAKIYCGLGLLKKENIKEVHRADLIGQHIGETEAKTDAIIDSALDGVLFLDEAYALVATGAKNDFGLVAIDTLLARMENDRDRLVVIIAGYRADLDRFLDTNQGLRSRFTRTIDFPSYQPAELIEIANFMAKRRDSAFEQPALDDLEALFAHLANTTKPDTAGVERRGLDIAGNGRFVRNVVEKSEEEREFRLDHSENAQTGEFTDEELITITAADLANTVPPLLEGLRLETPA